MILKRTTSNLSTFLITNNYYKNFGCLTFVRQPFFLLAASIIATATTTVVSAYAVVTAAEEKKKDYDNPSAVSAEKVITHKSLPPFFYITYYVFDLSLLQFIKNEYFEEKKRKLKIIKDLPLFDF